MSAAAAPMSAGLDVGVAGIGLLGPGLVDWASALPLLRDPALWQRVPTVVPAPALLPATERRRAGIVVKASVVVADAACAAYSMPTADNRPSGLRSGWSAA